MRTEDAMYIHNVRLGFATNSSSNHSIILNPALVADWQVPIDMDYGWDEFLLRSKQSKADYLAIQLLTNLRRSLSNEYAALIVSSLFNKKFDLDGGDYSGKQYIDHQSVFSLPYRYRKQYWHTQKEIDLQFFQELKDYIVENDDIAIAGGNDNDMEPVDYEGETDSVTNKLCKDGDYGFICRKDNDYWTLFSPETGAKIRLSFTSKEPYLYSSTPELVDLKITNFCGYGCSFCLQSSVIDGKHATLDSISNVFGTLQKMEVFEVALGGGETTMHPAFADILREAKGYNLIPNFTTFNMNWAKNSFIESAVLDCCGGVAVSLIGYKDYDKINEMRAWKESHRNSLVTLNAQIILGVADFNYNHLFEKIKEAKIDAVTLLGYKSFGRGKGLKKIIKPDFIQILQCAKKHYITLGIDTLIAQEYKGELEKENISNLLVTNREGVFSMYIDAVDHIIAKDSYTEDVIKYSTEYNEANYLPRMIEQHFPFKN